MLQLDIIAFFNASVLMSRTAVPLQAGVCTHFLIPVHQILIPYTQVALHGFIESSIDEKDLEQLILPQMEKALLRSPEVSLNGGRGFSVHRDAP